MKRHMKGNKTTIALVLLCLSVLLTSCGKKAPESYAIGADSVSSITAVLGEDRKLKEESEETDEDTGVTTKVFTYEATESSAEDVAKYVAFLVDTRGFVPLVTLDPEAAEGNASYAYKSVGDGKIFQMGLEYNADGYTVTVSDPEGELPEIKKEEEKEEEPKADPPGQMGSRTDALKLLESMTPEQLRLPYPITSYVTIFDEGRSMVNDSECYGVHAYLKREDRRMENMGIYYVTVDGNEVYHYSAEEDQFATIWERPEEEIRTEEKEKPKVDPAPGALTAEMLNETGDAKAKAEQDIAPGKVTAEILNQEPKELEQQEEAQPVQKKSGAQKKNETAEQAEKTEEPENKDAESQKEPLDQKAATEPEAQGAKTDSGTKEEEAGEQTGTAPEASKGKTAPSASKGVSVKGSDIAPGKLTAEDLND